MLSRHKVEMIIEVDHDKSNLISCSDVLEVLQDNFESIHPDIKLSCKIIEENIDKEKIKKEIVNKINDRIWVDDCWNCGEHIYYDDLYVDIIINYGSLDCKDNVVNRSCISCSKKLPGVNKDNIESFDFLDIEELE